MGHANEPVQLGSENLDTCRLYGTDSPDGVSQFRVVKQLVTSE
jgi:hypothetical protein